MPATFQKSAQLTSLDAGVKMSAPEGGGAPMRAYYFNATQAGAGTAGSTVELVRIPAGRVRIFTVLSSLTSNPIAGAGATCQVGYAAYTGQDGVPVAASVNAFTVTPLDVATTTPKTLNAGTGQGVLLDSMSGISIVATFTAIADLSVTAGYIVVAHQ
jgi:hypothetical protein